MAATSSATDTDERSVSSSIGRRVAATELIKLSKLAEGRSQMTDLSRRLRGNLEIDRPCEGVGDRRPLLDVGHQRVDLALRNALALHIDLDPHVGEPDRFLADVTGAPHGSDVEIALGLKLELV